MLQVLPFFGLFLLPLLSFAGLSLGGNWHFLTAISVFLTIPLLDEIVGDSKNQNPEPSNAAITLGRALTLLFIPVQFTLITYGVWLSAHAHWSTSEWIGGVLAVGLLTGGLGITIGHELSHRTESWMRNAGGVLLASVWYGHFLVEHVHGHHTWVATAKDPATSRLNESLYRFYPRTVIGSFISAIKIENEWLKKRKLKFYEHRVLNYVLLSLTFTVFAYWFAGLSGMLFFLLQSWVAFTLLELINYVEHYGLTRKILPDGKFESVQFYHSWDSRRIISNWMLINLERHSDHHKYPTRDFTKLRFHEEAPLLPAGYPFMLILSLFPPLWFKVMNKRVKSHSPIIPTEGQ